MMLNRVGSMGSGTGGGYISGVCAKATTPAHSINKVVSNSHFITAAPSFLTKAIQNPHFVHGGN